MKLFKQTQKIKKLNPIVLRNYSKLDDMNMFQATIPNMLVTGYFDHGFLLNDTHLFGSLILFPRNAFLWDCKSYKEITLNSLSIVQHLNPLPDILLIGTGEKQEKIDPEIYKHFDDFGISVETMSTFSALSTYNILNQEDRNVAVALVPLKEIDSTELSMDNLENKMKKLKEKK
eukprot:gene4722-8306_t